MGSTTGTGICHSYAPDGRCISLLKILLTNFCIFDCAYCINRRSSNVPRARFSVEEVVDLTIQFYKRNYIEGLFLSSGIIRSADYTMEQLVRVARTLREEHDFRGYIHLKTIPEAAEELIAQAGRVWWCLLAPSEEFKATMARFRFNDPMFWPFTLENAFSAAVRKAAMAEGAYVLGNQAQPDLVRDAGNAKRAVEALLELAPDDDSQFYLRTPTVEAKETFAAWIAAPEHRTPETYASFGPILGRLRELVEQHQAGEGRQARLL